MKKFALLLSALLVAGAAFAATQATNKAKSQTTKPSSHAMSTVKTHTIEAEVVSANEMEKTLTIKTDKGDQTVPVEGVAVSELKSVKAGEKVKLTCRDNEQGEHQAITKIHAEKSSTAATKKK
jgi:hypothetical protein